jgi:hypothetical protein
MKGAIPSAAIENEVSNSAPHPAPAGAKHTNTYNPYCLVSYFHYEATNKVLYCKDCIFQDCEFKKVRAV